MVKSHACLPPGAADSLCCKATPALVVAKATQPSNSPVERAFDWGEGAYRKGNGIKFPAKFIQLKPFVLNWMPNKRAHPKGHAGTLLEYLGR